MRALVLVLAIAGCSFHPSALHAAHDGAADAPDAGDAPAGWTHRKAIIIDGTQVAGGPFAPFVLLVRWSADPDVAAAAQAGGADLRFTTQAGAALRYERARYDATTGALVAWVQLPQLDATGATIYLWYGNPAATDQQDRAATWDATYAGVWHLDDAAGSAALADATTNGNAAAPMGGPMLDQPGIAGGAVAFDGVDDYLKVAQSASLSATTGEATFALWLDFTTPNTTHYQRILSSSNRFLGEDGTGTDDGYEWATQPAGGGDGYYLYPWGGAESYNLGATPFTAGVWAYAVATLDFAQHDVELYVDGVQVPILVKNSTAVWTMKGAPGDWLWGSNAELSGPFAGEMDELRVMTGVRSAGWIQTTYANQRPDQTFYTVGPAETFSASP